MPGNDFRRRTPPAPVRTPPALGAGPAPSPRRPGCGSIARSATPRIPRAHRRSRSIPRDRPRPSVRHGTGSSQRTRGSVSTRCHSSGRCATCRWHPGLRSRSRLTTGSAPMSSCRPGDRGCAPSGPDRHRTAPPASRSRTGRCRRSDSPAAGSPRRTRLRRRPRPRRSARQPRWRRFQGRHRCGTRRAGAA